MISQLKSSGPRLDLRSPLTAALIAFAVALPAFAMLRAQVSHQYEISKAEATRIARSDREVRGMLAGHRVTGLKVTPLDESAQRVTFFDGPRTILDAAVTPRGVTAIAEESGPGSEIANSGLVLALLTALFLLATVTLPLRSLQNLDVLALASFVAPVVLLNQRYVSAGVLASYPALIYLAARCMGVGLGLAGRPKGGSLFWHLTRGWPEAQRLRISRYAVLAAAALVAMVVPSSTGFTDVALAGVSGATDLLHGVAPYGHLPGYIYHGDTYPLLSYALYVPGAALIPYEDAFSDPSGALLVAGAAVLLAAWGLYRIGRRLAEREDEGLPGREAPSFAGMRIALAWLTFPPVILAASSGSNDAILAACVVVAFTSFYRPVLSTFLLGVAAWVKVLPLLALPIWLARLSGRAALRALAAIAALSALLVSWLLVLGGVGAVTDMLNGLAFQVGRGSLHSLWLGLDITELQPIWSAALLAAIVAATLAVRRESALRGDLRRMAALFAAVMLIAQIAANYWTWAYLPWALVPLLLSLLAPNALATAPASAMQEGREIPIDQLVPGQQADQPA